MTIQRLINADETSGDTHQVDDLTGLVRREEMYAVSGGGYADVFLCTLANPTANRAPAKVAVKVLRAHRYNVNSKWRIERRLKREIRVWSALKHPHIVPLLGTTFGFGPYASMVCPWMEEGEMYAYLKDKSLDDISLDRRLEILADIIEGLCYLHSQRIIHGDLTPSNILMHDGRAHLSDFGLSNVMAEVRAGSSTFLTSKVGGAARWGAPELYDPSIESDPINEELAPQCDIYSFGSVALYALSGEIPYAHMQADFLVVLELTRQSGHPPRPSESFLTDDCWSFITTCWNDAPHLRPPASEVKSLLLGLQNIAEPMEMEVDRNEGHICAGIRDEISAYRRVASIPDTPCVEPQLIVEPPSETSQLLQDPQTILSEEDSPEASILQRQAFPVAYKHYLTHKGTRAEDNSWHTAIAIIRYGELGLFAHATTVEDETWPTEEALLTIDLAHSLTRALPAPGYNTQRPHCMLIRTAAGAVYVLQADSVQSTKAQVTLCNYSAARASALPRWFRGPRPDMQSRMRELELSGGADWTASEASVHARVHADEVYLQQDLEMCIPYMIAELKAHTELKTKMEELYPRDSRRKTSLMVHRTRNGAFVRDIVKYRLYLKALKAVVPKV